MTIGETVSLELSATVNSGDVAVSIARDVDMQSNNYEGMIDFILDIDEGVCDLQFTVALRDRLSEIIETERQ